MSPSLFLLPTDRLVDATLQLFSVKSRKQSPQRHAYIAGRAMIASHADIFELHLLYSQYLAGLLEAIPSARGDCVLTCALNLS